MKSVLYILLGLILLFGLAGCTKAKPEASNPQNIDILDGGKTTADISMHLFINDEEIPVIWEENDTVAELMMAVAEGDIIVEMSMYINNEQVGSLGRTFTRDDKQITTQSGDIVLYTGNKIVVFYGSNTWEYTRLGKIDLEAKEIAELLSNGNIKLKITK